MHGQLASVGMETHFSSLGEERWGFVFVSHKSNQRHMSLYRALSSCYKKSIDNCSFRWEENVLLKTYH